MLRVDLQLHSRFSDRPTEWVLRRLGMPQSYSEPETLYRKLHDAGMTFKTITDHNRLEGCKAIAHHPDVFLSEEVTTYFPDGCKIHLLVWNLNEEQHEEIQKLRPSIYELAGYLRQQKLPHGVAHPLVNINKLLTVEHFERLVLLFRCFEGRNGNREPLAQEVSNRCLAAPDAGKNQLEAGQSPRARSDPCRCASQSPLRLVRRPQRPAHRRDLLRSRTRRDRARFFPRARRRLGDPARSHGRSAHFFQQPLHHRLQLRARQDQAGRAGGREPAGQDGGTFPRRAESHRLLVCGTLRPRDRIDPHRPGARFRQAGRNHFCP